MLDVTKRWQSRALFVIGAVCAFLLFQGACSAVSAGRRVSVPGNQTG